MHVVDNALHFLECSLILFNLLAWEDLNNTKFCLEPAPFTKVGCVKHLCVHPFQVPAYGSVILIV